MEIRRICGSHLAHYRGINKSDMDIVNFLRYSNKYKEISRLCIAAWFMQRAASYMFFR